MTTTIVRTDESGRYCAFSGVKIARLLSVQLFRESTEARHGNDGTSLAERCHAVWTDLASAIAALPEPLEGLFLFSATPEAPDAHAALRCSFLAVGRGADAETAAAASRHGFSNLRSLLRSNLPYAELEDVDDAADLKRITACFDLPHAIEFRRRLEPVSVGVGVLPASVGYRDDGTPPAEALEAANDEISEIPHLFPWTPSDDPWRRLGEVLLESASPAAFVAHVRGWRQAPEAAHHELLRTVAAIERLWIGARIRGPRIQTFLGVTLDALHRETLQRLAAFEGPLLAVRVFLTSAESPSGALLATALGSIDDASVRPQQDGANQIFRGGSRTEQVPASTVLAPLDAPTFDLLFGPREATAVCRTPMPTDADLPGLAVVRARTAAVQGRSGDDTPLGINVHRGGRVPVVLDAPSRFRHTYVVGQTGTGKSTLLARMILHDIERGRGVGVVDPHGTLIEDVLGRIPDARADDVLLLDLVDADRPVGFNPLCITETDPDHYRFVRDLVIDDLYAYLERTYRQDTMGPMFETHFRGMLALLLGVDPPVVPRIPNLLLFRQLYYDEHLRRQLRAAIAGRDHVIESFLKEAVRVTGDASLSNMAPYISSKFVRFINDTRLRNITSQPRTIDFRSIVDDGKILLVNLGRGRFGDYSAGLVASQIVTRFRHEVMRRGAVGAAKPFYLYVDEFQLCADQRFGELLAEARKFGLSLTLAHQYAQQLPEGVMNAILGNVGTVITFRLGPRDADLLEPYFAPQFGLRDLTALPNYRAYVRSTGTLGSEPFSLETRPADAEADLERAAAIRERSRLRYGHPRDEVEKEIAETLRAFGPPEPAPAPQAESAPDGATVTT